jgi:hypothetical protein
VCSYKSIVLKFTSPDAVIHYLLNSNRRLNKNFAWPQWYFTFYQNLMPIHTKCLDPNIRGASVASASYVRTSPVSADEHQKYVRLQHTALRNTVKSSVVLVASNVEICALLRNYAAYSGNSLPMFQDSLSVPSSRVPQVVPKYR